MAEIRTAGVCGGCGKFVLKIEQSVKPTCRADGVRYIYPGRPDDGSCIFRCENCHAVIDEVWVEEFHG